MVEKYQAGLEASEALRKERAKETDRRVWDYIVNFTIMFRPKTLREYAVILNANGITTSRGGPWTPALVGHLMKRRGANPKSLLDRVTKPRIYEPRGKWSAEAWAEYRRASEKLGALNDENGKWMSALDQQPRRTDLMRHADHGEGQVHAILPNAKFLCSYIGEDGSFEVSHCASEIEFFRWHLSREQRIERDNDLKARFEQRYGPAG